MTNDEILKETEQYLMPTYGRQPIAFVQGRGATLTDANGKSYVDFLAGLAVCSLGHCHPAVTDAIRSQAGELLHTSNLYLIANQSKLARYLVDLSFGEKVFFCNSGTEANEGAIKLARRWQEKIANHPERKTILSFDNSFHGRTLGSLAATGQTKYHDGFAPLPGGFTRVAYNDIEAVRGALDTDPTIGAILVETIQAEGGVICATPEFIKQLRATASERGVLLIFDEVQTGIGRTGKLFSYEHFGINPDIVTLAKGLGGGIAIGALISTNAISAAFSPGSHASTFGGNPLATAAAIAVIKTLLNDQVPERAAATGKFLMGELEKRRTARVKEIRGRGLLIGIELDKPAAPIVSAMIERGYIIGTAGEKVLRLAPPLIVSQNQCLKVAEVLMEVVG